MLNDIATSPPTHLLTDIGGVHHSSFIIHRSVVECGGTAAWLLVEP
jgi:hypothetical protein